VRFVPGDADRNLEAFAPGEVSLLTLLFADPWPHEKTASKRLTAPHMVERYRRMLAPGGHLHFRHDNPDFFHYSCETFRAAGFRLEISVEIDRSLTGFERRWLGEGRQIYGFDAYPPA
jgi:tRNA (guanine-N7-)-methyltransferase